MPNKKPTKQLVAVFDAFKANPERWLSVREIAEIAKTTLTTTQRHVGYLRNREILDTAAMHPAPYYKLRDNAQSIELAQELEGLKEVVSE